MSDILKDLHKSSFKGIDFFVKSVRTTGGRKIVIHEYPNRDDRYIEDIGKLDKSFTVTGVITSLDYFNTKQSLTEALESEGAGIFVHPFSGAILVKLSGNYDLDETYTELGYSTITIPFHKVGLDTLPIETSDNRATISTLSTELITSAEDNVINNYVQETKNAVNYNTVREKLENLGDYFDLAKTKANNVAGKINDFENTLLNFRDRITEIVNLPSELATEITGLFNAMNVLATDSIRQIDMFKAFFNFGDDDLPIVNDTASRLERIKNNSILNEIVLVTSLSLCYQNATGIEFKNTEEIDDLNKELNQQFNKISDLIQDSTTYDKLQELRKEAQLFFDAQRQIVYKIETINTKTIPTTILTYNYYGKLDNFEQILNLNNIIEPSFIEGDIKILTL